MLELAPLEGITTYVYRNAYAKHFGKIDKYYTPFISLHKEKEFNHKEKQEILPENNEGLWVVPQVLTNSAEDFLKAARKLKEYGYGEVNINMGCPSGTVTTKAKGAGMLADKNRLKNFLEEIFSESPVEISIKTRLGMERAEEWEELLDVYNSFPIKELIVHARVREDFYNNTPNYEAFKLAVGKSKNPLSYNGDVFSAEDYKKLRGAFPSLEHVMLGRGLIANPSLATEICGGEPYTPEQFKAFHDDIYAGYQAIQFGDRNILFKMKELWYYMLRVFPDGMAYEKKMKKVNCCRDYEALVRTMIVHQ